METDAEAHHQITVSRVAELISQLHYSLVQHCYHFGPQSKMCEFRGHQRSARGKVVKSGHQKSCFVAYFRSFLASLFLERTHVHHCLVQLAGCKSAATP